MPDGLVHIVPDKAALVLRVFFRQLHIAFHSAQRVAHIVHVFAQDERLFRLGFQIFPDFPRLGVHPAFHIGNGRKRAVMHHTFIMHQTAGVLGVEKLRHGQNILARIAFVAAGPDQHSGVVFVALQHAAGTVHHTVFPFRQAARHIPAGFDRAQLLPAAVAFQVGFIDHVNAVFVAQIIPQALVRVMAGAHGVDVVGFQHGHGGVHIIRINSAALFGVPFVAVYTVEHHTLPIQAHDAVLHLKAAETDVIGHHFLHGALCIFQRQLCMVQHRGLVAPRLNPLQLNRVPRHRAFIQGIALRVGQAQSHTDPFGLSIQLQLRGQQTSGVVLAQARFQPDVRQMHRRFGVQVYRAEHAGEAEKVLVLDPCCTAALVHFHADAVAGFFDVRRQVKFRGGKAVLGIAHELAIAPQVHGLFHPLEADAYPLPAQPGIQIKFPRIAADGVIVQIHLRRPQRTASIPRVQRVGVLQLTIALGLHMARHTDGTKARKIRSFAPEIRRALGRATAPYKAPHAVQRLAQAAVALRGFLHSTVAYMVRMGIQPVHGKHSRVAQPVQFRCHDNIAPFISA